MSRVLETNEQDYRPLLHWQGADRPFEVPWGQSHGQSAHQQFGLGEPVGDREQSAEAEKAIQKVGMVPFEAALEGGMDPAQRLDKVTMGCAAVQTAAGNVLHEAVNGE